MEQCQDHRIGVDLGLFPTQQSYGKAEATACMTGFCILRMNLLIGALLDQPLSERRYTENRCQHTKNIIKIYNQQLTKLTPEIWYQILSFFSYSFLAGLRRPRLAERSFKNFPFFCFFVASSHCMLILSFCFKKKARHKCVLLF